MRYFLHSAGHPEFGYSGYPVKKTKVSFGPATRSVTAGPVKLALQRWQTPQLGAVLMQYRSSERVRVTGEDPHDLIMLCFMSKGKINYQCRHIHTSVMTVNTNNFFYLPDVRITYQLEKDELNECFKIFLSRNYLSAITRTFASPFALLTEKINQHQPFELGTPHLITTPEMNRIIEQIRHCQSMGALAPFYFESKVRELLALQWQLPREQHSPDDLASERYRDQIDMARSIIEHNHRYPPGLHELSLRVGMCETLLKKRFKSVFGTTVFNYLFHYRMEMAHELLKDPSLTISQIAEQLGYKNQSHFTSTFKRKFKLPPLQYRKRNGW